MRRKKYERKRKNNVLERERDRKSKKNALVAQHVAHPLVVGEVIYSKLGPTLRDNQRR